MTNKIINKNLQPLITFIDKVSDTRRKVTRSSISKGDLMKLAYTEEQLRQVDSAIPNGILDERGIDNSEYWHYVMDYNNDRIFGRLTDLFDIIHDTNPVIEVYDEEYDLLGFYKILDASVELADKNIMFDLKK